MPKVPPPSTSRANLAACESLSGSPLTASPVRRRVVSSRIETAGVPDSYRVHQRAESSSASLTPPYQMERRARGHTLHSDPFLGPAAVRSPYPVRADLHPANIKTEPIECSLYSEGECDMDHGRTRYPHRLNSNRRIYETNGLLQPLDSRLVPFPVRLTATGSDIVPASGLWPGFYHKTTEDEEEPDAHSSPSSVTTLYDENERTLKALDVSTGTFVMRYGTTKWVLNSANLGIISAPSLQCQRKTWWDQILAMYSSDRSIAFKAILADLTHLFRTSDGAISFFHGPTFFSTILNSDHRQHLQPAVVLSCLALSTLLQSSEGGFGALGREKALVLQTAAQAALQASVDAQWIEPTLAQAAVVIVLFEIFPHPLSSEERRVSSLRMLDGIIHALQLCTLDIDSPNVTVFPSEVAPILPRSTPLPRLSPESDQHPLEIPQAVKLEPTAPCNCTSVSLSAHSAAYTNWVGTPGWSESWTDVAIRQEQNRRVCWAACRLASGHIGMQVATGGPTSQFHMTQSSNFALLFPAETLMGTEGKTSVWALYLRAMLLWNSCAEMYGRPLNPEERASYAFQVWTEADILESTLNKHTCSIEDDNAWSGRQYIHHARMSVMFNLQCFSLYPRTGTETSLRKREASEWVKHWQSLGQRQLDNPKHRVVTSPFIVRYLSHQLTRCLNIWREDPSLTDALLLGCTFVPIVEHMSKIYPSPESPRVAQAITQLTAACISCGVPPPSSSSSQIIITSPPSP